MIVEILSDKIRNSSVDDEAVIVVNAIGGEAFVTSLSSAVTLREIALLPCQLWLLKDWRTEWLLLMCDRQRFDITRLLNGLSATVSVIMMGIDGFVVVVVVLAVPRRLMLLQLVRRNFVLVVGGVAIVKLLHRVDRVLLLVMVIVLV